jgi:N-acetylmuramoyl-L-alanine amidase
MTINKTTHLIVNATLKLKPASHQEIDGPDSIVIHYTAGTSGESSANWLAEPAAKVSAHVVIDRSGKIFQVIPFNRVAWHAGQSAYAGRTGFNAFSLGIELDNAGYLLQDGQDYISSYGKRYSSADVIEAQHQHETSPRFWHTYTEEQLRTCRDLCIALIEAYPEIDQILGHDEIAPGRKQDPGPAFPMDSFRKHILYPA